MKLQPEHETEVRRLRRLRPGRPVLSVYLQTDPGLALHHGHVAKLMDLLRDLRETTPAEHQSALDSESQRLLAYVRDDYTPTGRSLVAFASSPRRLFQTMSLQLPLRSVARFAPKPYLTPLDLALDDHPRVAVALVSEEQVRLITTVLDEIESEREVKEHVPGRQRQGGWHAANYERDRLQHIATHYAGVVEELKALQKHAPFKWLVIAGAEPSTTALAGVLPRGLKSKLAGRFRAEQFAPSTEVAKHANRVAAEAERAEELTIARQIVDRAMARGAATLGPDTTLRALAEGRVHLLAIAASELTTAEGDRAVDLALESGAEVEVVHDAAEAVLAPHRGIGALLRY